MELAGHAETGRVIDNDRGTVVLTEFKRGAPILLHPERRYEHDGVRMRLRQRALQGLGGACPCLRVYIYHDGMETGSADGAN